MTIQTKAIPMALITVTLVLARSASHAQPAAALSNEVKAGVEEALQDEYRGEAMYSRVLKDHGDVRPFSNVVRAERRHAACLEDLLKARGLVVPDHHGATVEAPAFASVKEACAAAVEFETKNVALYDRLTAAGPLPDDVKEAFDHNRTASLEHHKPAFERCAGLATAQEGGRGAGRGQGSGRVGATGAGTVAGARATGRATANTAAGRARTSPRTAVTGAGTRRRASPLYAPYFFSL